MSLAGMPVRRAASQGQAKTYTIALRMAQYEFLAQATGMKPLLLLDDIFRQARCIIARITHNAAGIKPHIRADIHHRHQPAASRCHNRGHSTRRLPPMERTHRTILGTHPPASSTYETHRPTEHRRDNTPGNGSRRHATEAYDLQRVCTLWPEIVGPTINRFTTRRWIDRDVLHVAISSAALRNDLMFHRERLIAHLNRAAGKNIISNIIFH